jgi:peptidoglycan/xylan/chitin deacetylase (PgdA/CDA1 family)
VLLALKIDVDTLRGTREGVPRLVEMLPRHQAGATFFFSLGPDHTGRALRRATRPGYVARVRRSGVVSHYGLRTMLYGTVLPGPDIGRRAGDVMRAVRDAGFETGVHCHDHVRWHDDVATADAAWTEAEMQRAIDRYTTIFREPPAAHAAAGWQMNAHAFRLTQRFGFDYCSDGRGHSPHLPVWNAELVRCPQLPTTLPTVAELLNQDGIDVSNVGAHALAGTAEPAGHGHVFTVQAELEGMKLAPVFEQMLLGWTAQGYRLVPLRALYDSVEPMALPRCEVGWGEVPGCSGRLIVQGDEFLGGVDLAQAA